MTIDRKSRTRPKTAADGARRTAFVSAVPRKWLLLAGVVLIGGGIGIAAVWLNWGGSPAAPRTRRDAPSAERQSAADLGAAQRRPTPSPVMHNPPAEEPPLVPAEPSPGPPELPIEPVETPLPRSASLPATIEQVHRETLSAVEQLLEDFPAHAAPIALLGRVYDGQGNSAEAVNCWQRVLEIEPKHVAAYQALGGVALRKGQYEKAVEFWQKVEQIAPTTPGANNYVARALICLGRTDEAIAALQRDIEISPGAFHSHFMLAQRYLQAKRYEEAERSFRRTIELRPEYTNAYYTLATVCARLGKKDDAKRLREKFRELQKQDFQDVKDRTETHDDLKSARRKAAAAYTTIGRYYDQFEFARRAEKSWRRAALLAPEDRTCRLYLAELYRAGGRNEEALRAFEEVRRIGPETSLLYAQIGNLRIRTGRIDEAMEAFRKIIELTPERPEGYGWLAQLYLRENRDLPEAKRLAAEAVRLAPTVENYLTLADACDRGRDRAGALAALKQAMKLDPDNAEIERFHDRIEKQK